MEQHITPALGVNSNACWKDLREGRILQRHLNLSNCPLDMQSDMVYSAVYFRVW
jgi:hypothetical protein